MIQLARHQYSHLLVWLWLASLLGFTFLFWLGEKGKPRLPSSITALDLASMLALFAFAIAVGSYLLMDVPAGWIIDEGPFWLMARGYALGEQELPLFDLGVFSFPASSSMLQGWIMRWAGIDFRGWRFASVLPAAATVVPLYLLTHELFDRRTAVMSNVMMVVNPYFLTFSRLGYNNSQALFPVTLCIYFLVLGIRRNSRFHLWLAGLAAGLGFHTYYAAWLGLVVVTLAFIGFSQLRGVKFKEAILPSGIILVGAFAIFLPRLLYGMSGDNAIYLRLKFWESVPINTFYAGSIFGAERVAQTVHTENFLPCNTLEIFYDLPLYGILLARGTILSAAVFFDPIVDFDHQIIHGLSGPVSSIFFVLGLGVIFGNFRKLQNFIPATWFLAGFLLFGALSTFPPRPTHLIAILPVLSLISAVGLGSFVDVTIHEAKGGFPWEVFASVSILFVIAAASFIQFFFLAPYIYHPPSRDDYISWMYRQIPHPATVFLVDYRSAERNPLDEGIIGLTPHTIVMIARSDIESNPGQMQTWGDFAVFIEANAGREFAEWIARQIPGSHVQAALASGKRLQGYVITDMQFDTAMDVGVLHGMRGLWDSPARNIFVACGLAAAAFWLGSKMAKTQTSYKINQS
jgi:4-amino-4-deoxy-L-arabinose transferase-like glycosyltransferase